mgnify:CR=1 FL=1
MTVPHSEGQDFRTDTPKTFPVAIESGFHAHGPQAAVGHYSFAAETLLHSAPAGLDNQRSNASEEWLAFVCRIVPVRPSGRGNQG